VRCYIEGSWFLFLGSSEVFTIVVNIPMPVYAFFQLVNRECRTPPRENPEKNVLSRSPLVLWISLD
jgi:hypothetical protein